MLGSRSTLAKPASLPGSQSPQGSLLTFWSPLGLGVRSLQGRGAERTPSSGWWPVRAGAWSYVWSFSPRPRVEETRGMQVGHGGPEEQPSASDPTPSWHVECPALESDLGCPCSCAHTRPPAGLPS